MTPETELFAPPKAAVPDVAGIRRPIGVWIVSILCVLQSAFYLWMLSKMLGWAMPLAERGARSPLSVLETALGATLFPGLLMVGGICLFFMKRAASYLFGVGVIWKAAVMLVDPHPGMSLIDLIWAALCFAYCVQLGRTGRLR